MCLPVVTDKAVPWLFQDLPVAHGKTVRNPLTKITRLHWAGSWISAHGDHHPEQSSTPGFWEE